MEKRKVQHVIDMLKPTEEELIDSVLNQDEDIILTKDELFENEELNPPHFDNIKIFIQENI